MEGLAELLGESPTIEVVRGKLRRLLARQRVGQRLPPILLQADTGTGKGLVARLLHRHGARRQAPFVDVNCAAIPETLLEAELFGFEQGAFTDARRAKRGLFQAAHGGVLFLDEVALLSESSQAKLLTAIEERAIRPLGSTRVEPADVWLISATNVDLRAAVAARRFRADLYHRLAVLTIDLPPLRLRGRDILLLAEHFLARACSEYGLPAVARRRGPGPIAHAFVARQYPRARECHRAGRPVLRFVGGDGGGPGPAGGRGGHPTVATGPPTGTAGSRDEVMRQHLLAALEETSGISRSTAARLGIARNTAVCAPREVRLAARATAQGGSPPLPRP